MNPLKRLLYLLPLFVIYLAVIAALGSSELEGDGIRYFANAEHFLNGDLTDPDRPNIRNGPIYPLLILPIVGLNLPIHTAYLLNAILLLGAAVFLKKLLQNWLKPAWALALTYVILLYPPLLLQVPKVAYECLSIFWVSAYLYYSFQILYREKKGDFWLAGLFLALLALTKLIFPYAILILILGSAFLFVRKRNTASRKFLQAHAFAYLLLIPYLFLTYQATGKAFFWANSGSEILYWKSSPYKGEFGDWFQPAMVGNQTGLQKLDSCGREELYQRHSELYSDLLKLKPLEMSEVLSQKARENRQAHPEAFVKNSIASFSRLFFNFPFSYNRQKLTTLPFVLLNMFVLVMGFFGLLILVLRWRDLPTYFWFSLIISLVYMGGMTLLNGRIRHLIPIIPFIVVFLSYIYAQMVEFRWKEPTSLNASD